jgi:hypothetical protein
MPGTALHLQTRGEKGKVDLMLPVSGTFGLQIAVIIDKETRTPHYTVGLTASKL